MKMAYIRKVSQVSDNVSMATSVWTDSSSSFQSVKTENIHSSRRHHHPGGCHRYLTGGAATMSPVHEEQASLQCADLSCSLGSSMYSPDRSITVMERSHRSAVRKSVKLLLDLSEGDSRHCRALTDLSSQFGSDSAYSSSQRSSTCSTNSYNHTCTGKAPWWYNHRSADITTRSYNETTESNNHKSSNITNGSSNCRCLDVTEGGSLESGYCSRCSENYDISHGERPPCIGREDSPIRKSIRSRRSFKVSTSHRRSVKKSQWNQTLLALHLDTGMAKSNVSLNSDSSTFMEKPMGY